MESEFQILDNIQKNKNATQREIARKTGMSLGNVNILIKRLVRKGMLKVERLTPRTIRYILTPEGLKEKAEITYRYIVDSYKLIHDMQERIEWIVSGQAGYDITNVVLLGSRDEICEMLESRLRHMNISFYHATDVKDIHQYEKAAFFVWHPDYVQLLSESNIKYVNLLDEM